MLVIPFFLGSTTKKAGARLWHVNKKTKLTHTHKIIVCIPVCLRRFHEWCLDDACIRFRRHLFHFYLLVFKEQLIEIERTTRLIVIIQSDLLCVRLFFLLHTSISFLPVFIYLTNLPFAWSLSTQMAPNWMRRHLFSWLLLLIFFSILFHRQCTHKKKNDFTNVYVIRFCFGFLSLFLCASLLSFFSKRKSLVHTYDRRQIKPL